MAADSLQSMPSLVNHGAPISRRSSLRNPLRLFISAEPWLALIFMIASFVVGVFWLVVLVTLLGSGLALAITLVGLPILAGTMLFWTYGARFERLRVGALLGQPISNPYRPLPDGPALDRLRAHVRDPHVWLDLLYLVLLFPIGTVEFLISATMVSLAGLLLTAPIYYNIGDGLTVNLGNTPRHIDTFPEAMAAFALSIPLLLIMPYVFVGVGRGHAWLARQLLGSNREAELEARVGRLTESRSRAMDAALVELQRIERNLHDGAQQRLVKLGMDLGMAREKMKTDPAAAEALIAEAHEEAKRAMAEIRDLARGILPAVLTDRGLDPAISALAGRSPIPVTVDVSLEERLPVPVETTAYFVVAEALTNVARHSRATEAHVVVKLVENVLHIDVIDNGVGGVDDTNGTGLSGLRDRLSAVDGTLTVSSPDGGPTRLHAEIPCA